MDAKMALAWEIVQMYHGEEAANQAKEDFEKQFRDRGMPSEVPTVPLARALGDKADEAGNLLITDLLINTGLAPSRKRASGLIQQGGVSVDGERVTDFRQTVKPVEGMVVKVGRNYVKIVG
jgi:tyrosyl-tRNA synthetase